MGKELEISRQSRIAEMLEEGRRISEIKREVAISATAAYKYKNEYDKDRIAFLDRIAAKQKAEMVRKMLEDGCSLKHIMHNTKASKGYVMRMMENIADQEDKENEKKERSTELQLWLKKYWHWESDRSTRQRINPKTGYRKVYVGERGHLRTPYRPDYIWR